MRGFTLVLAIGVALPPLGRGADVTDVVSERIEEAAVEYRKKENAVRDLLVAATHRASKPQNLAEAMAAVEMFDTHHCVSAESSEEVRRRYNSARSEYLNKLRRIQRDAVAPDDKTKIAETVAALQAERRFDLSGAWEVRTNEMPVGGRRVYDFTDQQNGYGLTVRGDPDIWEYTGTIEWNKDWTALTGKCHTVFGNDRSKKRRVAPVKFEVIDVNTLRGTHTRFFWDKDGNETKTETYGSILKRVGAANVNHKP